MCVIDGCIIHSCTRQNIFFQYAGQYELMSYSSHGCEVDGTLYRCEPNISNSSITHPPPTPVLTQLRELIHKHRISFNKHGASGYNFTLPKDDDVDKPQEESVMTGRTDEVNSA